MARTPKDKSAAEGKSAIDKELIRELAELLDETGLTEIEIERDGLRVRVGRGGTVATRRTVRVCAGHVAHQRPSFEQPTSPSIPAP